MRALKEISVKYQLAQLAYDIIALHLMSSGEAKLSPFDENSNDFKQAYMEGVWAAVEAGKNKTLIKTDSISLKELDDGYLVYAGCKEIKKRHPSLTTYSKFPEDVKDLYRHLALKAYEKIDNQDGEINKGVMP